MSYFHDPFVASDGENNIPQVQVSIQEESDIELDNIVKQANEYDSDNRIE